MAILQIVPDLKVGGVQTSVVSLSAALAERGVDVVLVSLGPETDLAEELGRHRKVTLIVLGMKRASVLAFPLFAWSVANIVLRLAAIMREHDVNLVQGHLANASLLGCLAAIYGGVSKRFATFHSILFLPRESGMDLRNRLMLMTLRRIAPLFTRYIAISEAVRDAMIGHGIPERKVVTIANGVELSDFAHVPKHDIASFRDELGLSEKQRVVVCVGTLRDAKGHRYLIEAASQLVDEFPDVAYLFVGDGKERQPLEALVHDKNLETRIQFLGSRRDISRILSASDLFVLPSLWEGLPIALLEAMACGLPCVATRVAGNVEVLRDGESGLLVAPRESAALADGIRRVLRDPDLAAALGRGAKATVTRDFTMDGMANRLLALYDARENP